MTPLPLPDALAQARADWLAGQRGAWSRYAACIAQIRAVEPARPTAPPPLRRVRPPAAAPAPRARA